MLRFTASWKQRLSTSRVFPSRLAICCVSHRGGFPDGRACIHHHLRLARGGGSQPTWSPRQSCSRRSGSSSSLLRLALSDHRRSILPDRHVQGQKCFGTAALFERRLGQRGELIELLAEDLVRRSHRLSRPGGLGTRV